MTTSLVTTGCQALKKQFQDETTADATSGVVSIANGRIPLKPRAAIGPQGGFIPGGLGYIAVHPAKAQKWLQQLPLTADMARDLARAGAELGVDLRVDDVVNKWGVDSQALVSMTLFRPSQVRTAKLREALAKDPGTDVTTAAVKEEEARAALERARAEAEAAAAAAAAAEAAAKAAAEATATEVETAEKPIERTTVVEQPALEPSTPPSFETFEPPPPPPPPPKPTRHIHADLADSLHLHSRIHFQLRDRATFLQRLGEFDLPKPDADVAQICDRVAPTLLCNGEHDAVVVIRDAEGGAADLDFFIFPAADRDSPVESRAAAIQESLAIKSAALPELADMAGDFAGHLDGRAIVPVAELTAYAKAFDRMSWQDPSEWGNGLARAREELDKLHQARDTRRLFTAIRSEATIGDADGDGTDGRDVQITTRWVPVDEEARALSESLFARPANPADMPTIDSLCKNSLACFRSRGLPQLQSFRQLATGIYGMSWDEFGDVVDDAHELVFLSMFVETWPNLIGLAQQIPSTDMDKMAAGIVSGVMEIMQNVEGFGGTLEAIRLRKGGGDVEGFDFAAFARAPSASASVIRGLMGFGDIRFTPVELPVGADQQARPEKAERAGLPGAVPFGMFVVTDAQPLTIKDDNGSRDVPFGWLALADSETRLAWLLGLPRENPVTPALYGEIPDMWRLATSVEDASDEMLFARSWLEKRYYRAAFDVIDGWPHIDILVAADENAPPPTTPPPTPKETPPPPPPPPPPVG